MVKGSGFPPEDLHTRLHVLSAQLSTSLLDWWNDGKVLQAYRDRRGIRATRTGKIELQK